MKNSCGYKICGCFFIAFFFMSVFLYFPFLHRRGKVYFRPIKIRLKKTLWLPHIRPLQKNTKKKNKKMIAITKFN